MNIARRRKRLGLLCTLVFACLTLSAGSAMGTLVAYVAQFTDGGEGKIIQFNLATGASKVFAPVPSNGDPLGARPRGVAVDDLGRVYAGLRGAGRNVVRFAPDGTFLGDFTGSIYGAGTGLISFDQRGDLIVAGDVSLNHSVFRFAGGTGALIDTFNHPAITNVVGMTVYEDSVFAAGVFDGDIVKFDLSASPVLGDLFVSNAVPSAAREKLTAMTIGHTGNLFAASFGTGLVNEFDINTGALIRTFFATTGPTRDLVYDPITQRYYRSGDSLFAYDINGQLVSTFTHPELDTGYGIAIVEAVPVPAALPLFGSAVVLLGFLAVRRRGKQA